MNQIQTLIDAGREALTSNGIHDTILAVGIAAIPILIFCVIVNRLRHPDRSFLGGGRFRSRILPSAVRSHRNRYPLGLHRRRGWTAIGVGSCFGFLAFGSFASGCDPLPDPHGGRRPLNPHRPRTHRGSRREREAPCGGDEPGGGMRHAPIAA